MRANTEPLPGVTGYGLRVTDATRLPTFDPSSDS